MQLPEATRQDKIAKAGFDEFYRANYAWARQLAFVLAGSDETANDVAHDAFTAVYGRFDTLMNPGGYLRTVIVNACHRFHRRRRLARNRLALIGDADEGVLRSETIELLSGVRRLPYWQQVVVVLHYWAQLPFTEIAVTLHRPVSTVRSLHHRALSTLRKEFS